jgi:glycine cleavage system H protein
MNYPTNLKYSKEHEWVRLEGNKAYIGITHFAQSELGDIVFVELPSVGDEVDQDSTFGSVESVKTVSDLYMPVTGKILQVNGELDDSPELINDSPYDQGWMIVVEVADLAQVDGLMSADEYENLVKED